MKKIYTLFLTLTITGCLMAQAPQSFKYQAIARNAGGQEITDQTVGMQISILQGSTSGTAVYVETFATTTNGFGLINLNIGEGTMVSGDFTAIDWSSSTYFIKVEMDASGGTAYEEYGTSQLLSVPYALHAKTAANTFSGNYSDLTGTPSNVSTFTNDAGYLTGFAETDPIYTAWNKSTGISITESQISDFGNYESAFAKNTAFNKNFGNSVGTVTEGNDSRLSDARIPISHAASHTNGTDDIQDATSSQKGLMTAAYAIKLDGIEGGAEINVNADWNVSSGDAQILNKPSDLTDLSIHNVTELADISDAGSGIIISSTERTKLSGIETSADVTDATNVDAAGAVMESDFDAGTFLYATNDNTPQPKTVSETKGILSLNNVENTALTTWAGSGNITSLGTVTSGTLSTGAVLEDVTMSLGSDADGDIYYRSGSKLTRLTIGADDQILTSESGAPVWKDATGGSTTYTVGDFAQGGIVFWVDETGQHGLVCAKEDQSSSMRWYAGTFGVTRANGDGPLAGEMNTAIIIAAQVALGDDGLTYAACICVELQITEGGKTYGDWYLPSKEELILMYENKATIDATAIANGGVIFASDRYWSSTEYGNRNAWEQGFSSGIPSINDRTIPFCVRAVRAF